MTAAGLAELLQRFEARTLTKQDWTHEMHLRVAAGMILRHGADEALGRLREGIRRLNDSHATVNSDTGGYHETITVAYVRLIAGMLERLAEAPAGPRVAAMLASPLAEREVLLRFYSRERLYSAAARREWHEPDRAALSPPLVWLRPTEAADLGFVLALERNPANAGFVGQWPVEEHAEAIARPDREHWVVESLAHEPCGFLIVYDLRAAGLGMFVKRMVVAEHGRGAGRAALTALSVRVFDRLDAECLWLVVHRDNRRAQRAYRAAGLREIDLDEPARRRRQRLVGGFADQRLVMERR